MRKPQARTIFITLILHNLPIIIKRTDLKTQPKNYQPFIPLSAHVILGPGLFSPTYFLHDTVPYQKGDI